MLKRTSLLLFVLLIWLTINVAPAFAQKYDVTICTVSVGEKGGAVEKALYQVGDKIQVKVKITNTSDQKVNIPKGNDWYRPQLIRNGQIIPYRKEVLERFEKRGQPGGCCTVNGFLFPEPRKSGEDTIDLDYWYGTLEVGQYQLSLERIFFGPESIYSNVALFEVVAAERKPANAP